MKAVLSGIVVALAVAALAALVLTGTQRESYDVYTAAQSVRLGNPGHNLLEPYDREEGGGGDEEAAGS